MMFEKIVDGIWQLKVPFEDIYTSVFVLNTKQGCILADCATNGSDVQTYIVPALERENFVPEILLCSHTHSDHAGGMETLIQTYPKATVAFCEKNVCYNCEKIHDLQDGEVLLERFEVLNLKGHSSDSIAIYDRLTKGLLSFDCLQQKGISRYRNGVTDPKAYLEDIERIRKISPQYILASHDYEPLGALAVGADAVNALLEYCKEEIEFHECKKKFETTTDNSHASGKDARKNL